MLVLNLQVRAGEEPGRGAWGDTTTLAGLMRDYGTWRLFSGADQTPQGWATLLRGVSLYFANLPAETLFIGPVLAAVGLFGAWGVCVTVFHALANLPLDHPKHAELFRAVHARFWLQPNTLLAPVSAVGALHWETCDRSTEWGVWECGWAVLDSVPLGGVLMVKGDLNTNAVRYLTQCEGARPNVAQLDLSHMSYPWFAARQAERHFPDITFPGRRLTKHRAGVPGGYNLEHLLAANIHARPIVVNAGAATRRDYALR
ncbi:hypothetical protein T484DRAFT_1803171 [Baffinella frigidus]|nr:hypothetical protein T484DRAFT_1803171 [Cryptophyta sp. CCMP2293]